MNKQWRSTVRGETSYKQFLHTVRSERVHHIRTMSTSILTNNVVPHVTRGGRSYVHKHPHEVVPNLLTNSNTPQLLSQSLCVWPLQGACKVARSPPVPISTAWPCFTAYAAASHETHHAVARSNGPGASAPGWRCGGGPAGDGGTDPRRDVAVPSRAASD